MTYEKTKERYIQNTRSHTLLKTIDYCGGSCSIHEFDISVNPIRPAVDDISTPEEFIQLLEYHQEAGTIQIQEETLHLTEKGKTILEEIEQKDL